MNFEKPKTFLRDSNKMAAWFSIKIKPLIVIKNVSFRAGSWCLKSQPCPGMIMSTDRKWTSLSAMEVSSRDLILWVLVSSVKGLGLGLGL